MNEKVIDRGWSQMQLLLDEHLPLKEKQRAVGWYYFFGLLAVGLIVFFIMKSLSTATTPMATSTNEVPSSAIIEVKSNSNKGPNSNAAVSPYSSAIKGQSSRRAQTVNSDIEINPIISFNSSNAKSIPSQSSKDELITSSSAGNSRAAFSADIKEHSPMRKNQVGIEAVEDELLQNSKPLMQENQTTDEMHSEDGYSPTGSDIKSQSLSFDHGRITEIALLHHRSNFITSTTSDQLGRTPLINVQPISTNRLSLYVIAGTQWAESSTSYEIGGGLLHRISPKLQVSTGISFRHEHYEDYSIDPGASLPTTGIFENSLTFSTYLADNKIESANFISSIDNLVLPIEVHYSLFPKLKVALGMRPTVQFNQKLAYHAVSKANANRNPTIANGELTASDFISQKPVFVFQSSVGIEYEINRNWGLGFSYQIVHSNLARGVRYANSSTLDPIISEGINRNFYSLPSKAYRENSLGLSLKYSF